MTSQKDKGINSISYNYLDLPSSVIYNTSYIVRDPFGGEIERNVNTQYLYNAGGTKLKTEYTSFHSKSQLEIKRITEYLDNFQYENGILQFSANEEGYYDFVQNRYIYTYKDHLGNIRLSYFKNAGGSAEVLEENNYYPFGLRHTGYYPLTETSYRYKYNGKEVQENGMYDYGARMYMPEIARWGVMDPLAEMYRRHSPYNYTVNNPVSFIDPDGRSVQYANGNITYGGGSAVSLGASLIAQAQFRNAVGGGANDSYDSRSGGSDIVSFISAFGDSGGGGGNPPFVFMIGGADLAFGLMGKSDTTVSIENVLKRSGMFVSSSNHDYFGSNKSVTQGFADYVAAQYSILKSDVILYGYSRGGVEVMEVARLLDKQNIPIKLMVLLDAANGPYSSKVNRVIPGNVQNVINYYQTDAKSNKLRSIGGPAIKTSKSNTSIQNYNVTGSYFFPGGSKGSSPINHSNIDEAYRDEVLYNILKYGR